MPHGPQASLPFSAEALAFIAALDGEADAALLRRELPMLREGCLRVLQLTTLLLQRAAGGGLTLAQIGGMVSRPLVGIGEEPSQLERLVAAAASDLAAAAPVPGALPHADGADCSSGCGADGNFCGEPDGEGGAEGGDGTGDSGGGAAEEEDGALFELDAPPAALRSRASQPRLIPCRAPSGGVTAAGDGVSSRDSSLTGCDPASFPARPTPLPVRRAPPLCL